MTTHMCASCRWLVCDYADPKTFRHISHVMLTTHVNYGNMLRGKRNFQPKCGDIFPLTSGYSS